VAQLTGWPTPNTRDTRRGCNQKQLATEVDKWLSPMVGWPTPVSDPANGTPEAFLERKRRAIEKGSSMGVALTEIAMVAQMMGWPTPTGQDNPQVAGQYATNGTTLGGAAQQAGWPTPQAADGGKIGSKPNFGQVGLSNHPALHGYPEREPMQKSREGDGQTTNLSGWNSPRATDGSNGGPNQSGGALSNDAAGSATPLGQTQSGSPSETGSKGVLNPALPLWMMGYPIYWVQCAPQKRGRKRKV